jgi:hypothetical protein
LKLAGGLVDIKFSSRDMVPSVARSIAIIFYLHACHLLAQLQNLRRIPQVILLHNDKNGALLFIEVWCVFFLDKHIFATILSYFSCHKQIRHNRQTSLIPALSCQEVVFTNSFKQHSMGAWCYAHSLYQLN